MQATTEQEDRRLLLDLLLMMAIIATNSALQIWIRDLVPSAGGLGWDGIFYAQIVQHPSIVFYHLEERAQRILPSLMVSGVLQLFHLPKDSENIIRTFQIFNGAMLTLDVLPFIGLCRLFHISRWGRWLAFVGIFFSYANAKMPFSYPVLTDTFGFTLAMYGFFFIFKRNPIALFLILLCASFTWSTLSFWLIPAVIFPPSNTKEESGSKPSLLLTASMVSVYLFAVYYSLFVLHYGRYGRALPIQQEWLPISIGVATIYLSVGSYFVFKGFNIPTWRMIYNAISVKGVLISAFVVLVARLILNFILLSPGKLPLNETIGSHYSIFIRSVTVPGIFAVSHAVFYGPIFVFAVLFWRNVSSQGRQLGYGFLMIMALTLFFSISSESRHLLPAYPLIGVLSVKAIDRLNLQKIYMPITLLGTFLASKIWYRQTVHMFDERVTTGYLTFPLQRYYMTQGPWMSLRMYVLQGAIALVFASLCFLIYRVRIRPDQDLRSITY